LVTQLCDQYGFYVIAEADVESHGCANTYGDRENKIGMPPRHFLTKQFNDAVTLSTYQATDFGFCRARISPSPQTINAETSGRIYLLKYFKE
jgi:hypothetical protein